MQTVKAFILFHMFFEVNEKVYAGDFPARLAISQNRISHVAAVPKSQQIATSLRSSGKS
jgi:hypothetical protein